jgi:hypothetical protein
MRTIETKVYLFNELDDQTQEKAIQNNYHIAVQDDWHDFIDNDLKEIGIELRSFDVDRGSFAEIHIDYFFETCEKIIETHGENCETYKIAKRYIKEYNSIQQKIDALNDDDHDFDLDYLDEEYQKEFSEEVFSMLRKEYEHMTSEEYLIEMFEANEYEFTAEGEMI